MGENETLVIKISGFGDVKCIRNLSADQCLMLQPLGECYEFERSIFELLKEVRWKSQAALKKEKNKPAFEL